MAENLNATQTQFIDRKLVAMITQELGLDTYGPKDTLPSGKHGAALLGPTDTLPTRPPAAATMPAALPGKPPPAAPPDTEKQTVSFDPGTRIYHGRYELLEPLGAGATAEVWKSVDTLMGVVIALKILKAAAEDKSATLQFGADGEAHFQARREVLTALFLQHPNIIRVLHMGEHEDALFIAMQYIDGTTLEGLLERRPDSRLEVPEMMDLCEQVLDALDFAHTEGFLHGDIKPANIMLEKRRGRTRVYLADFGVSRTFQEIKNLDPEDEKVVGTPAYVAPEIIRKDAEAIDRRADVYAMGVMMFQLLTGRLPFWGSNIIQILIGHLTQPPPQIAKFRRDVPPAMQLIVNRCLEKNPEDRFQSAGELLHTLRAHRDDILNQSTGYTGMNPTISIPDLTPAMGMPAVRPAGGAASPALGGMMGAPAGVSGLNRPPPDLGASGGNPAARLEETGPSPRLPRIKTPLPGMGTLSGVGILPRGMEEVGIEEAAGQSPVGASGSAAPEPIPDPQEATAPVELSQHLVALVMKDPERRDTVTKLLSGYAEVRPFNSVEEIKPTFRDTEYRFILHEIETAALVSDMVRHLRLRLTGKETPVILIEPGRSEWYKAHDGLMVRLPEPLRLDDVNALIKTYLKEV